MKNRIFELSTSLIARIRCAWLTHKLGNPGDPIKDRLTRREPQVSLEIIDASEGGRTPVSNVLLRLTQEKNLKKLRDELDKAIFIAEAMTIDQEASEGHVRDLYGNGITIGYALKHGLLKDDKEGV